MSNDKMRDEFDSWIEKQGMSTMKDGETYYHRVTHVAWQAWKASRAAPAVQGKPLGYVVPRMAARLGEGELCGISVLDQPEDGHTLPVYLGPQPAEQQPELAKYQPCGCVICTCEHETQCQGCGGHHCGTHPVGQFSNPVYQQPAEQQPAPAVQGEPVVVPTGFRVMKPTGSAVREGERWEIYAPCGSGGIVHEDEVKDWVVRKLLDALATAPQPAEQHPCPEDIREGAPYDDPAFSALCREHEIWGTPAAAQCAVFWEAGKRVAEQKPAPDVAGLVEALEAIQKAATHESIHTGIQAGTALGCIAAICDVTLAAHRIGGEV